VRCLKFYAFIALIFVYAFVVITECRANTGPTFFNRQNMKYSLEIIGIKGGHDDGKGYD
jgi:hypothetical protein